MPRQTFTERLTRHGVLIADGATGTNYQDMGIEPAWRRRSGCSTSPTGCVELHRAFVDAGSDLS